MRQAEIAVRPPYGGHPRLAIYGLLEARMSRAGLVICGGMNPRAIRLLRLHPIRCLRRRCCARWAFPAPISASVLPRTIWPQRSGAPEVVLSHAARDAAGPVIPSRFLPRIRAMLGRELHRETEAVRIARALDAAPPAPP